MSKLWHLHYGYGDSETHLDIPAIVAQGINNAIKAGQSHFISPLRTFKIADIRSLEETMKEDVDGKKLLAAGQEALSAGRPIVIRDDQGYELVKVNVLKKQVSIREMTSYYSKHPSYSLLGDGWVKYTRPAHLGIPGGSELAL